MSVSLTRTLPEWVEKLDLWRYQVATWETLLGVKKQVWESIEWTSFEQVINKIKDNFLSWNSDDEMVKSLLKETEFQSKVNDYLFSRFQKVIDDGKANSYDEIYFFIYLLSVWYDVNFFEDGDVYSENNFWALFDKYIEKIKSSSDLNSKETFSTIESFFRLCWVLNMICMFSQNDNLRRDDILELRDFVIKKINELSSYLDLKSYENKDIKNMIEYVLWLLDLNFTYIKYVPLARKGEKNKKGEKQKNKIDSFFSEYRIIYTNTLEWYRRCEKSNFWNRPDLREQAIKRVSYINLVHIVSLIVFKLREWWYNFQDIWKNEDFKFIIDSFLKYTSTSCWEEKQDYNSFEYIEEVCDSILIKNYDWYKQLSFDELFNYKDNLLWFLQWIINWNEVTDVDNLEIIHNLVLSNDLPEEILFGLLDFLFSENSSANENFEVIKLKIFNIVLSRLASSKSDKLKEFLQKLTKYIDKNKISSHLLFVYSLMYASIWYCYSFFNDKESQCSAFENYAKFVQINTWEFDFSRYWIDINRFYQNIWEFKLRKSWELWENCEKWCKKWFCSDDAGSCIKFTNESIMSMWRVFLREFSESYISQRNNALLNELDTFLSSQKMNTLDLRSLSEKVSNTLSWVFYWVADIEVVDIHSTNNTKSHKRNTTTLDFPIINGYKIRMTFPTTFSEYFSGIYKNNSGINQDDRKNIIEINHTPDSYIWKVFNKLWDFLEKYNEENKVELELMNDFAIAFEIDEKWESRILLNAQGIHSPNGDIYKYEILTRIKDSKRKENWTEYNIREYIDIAIKRKRYDLLRRLIEFTIESFISMMRWENWIAISINTEYINITDNETIKLLEWLADTWFNTSRITIELIEWKWENNEAALSNLRKLKNLWFKIAMDDYGAWESSLTRLLKLLEYWLLDYVKIDWEIVKNLSSKNPEIRRSAKIIIEDIVKLCDIWNVTVVAEYVEDEKLFNSLFDLWVKLFQWWYFSKAIPLNKIM